MWETWDASDNDERSTKGRGAALTFRAQSLVRVVVGVSVGLAATEGLFQLRDRGAFPRLNVYEADPELGVRLRAGATERVAFNKNPVSHVRINSRGLRGPETLATPPTQGSGDHEVVVVGDSQVFGLGVEEDETFTSLLASEIPGRTFVNAGVPTYGPLEYQAVTKRLLDTDQAKTVVYVVNLANDLFEAARPNRDRHVAYDGWALRTESADGAPAWFPGREFLLRESHAFFAYRAWRHHEPGNPRASVWGTSFASEGTWEDLLGRTAKNEGLKTDQAAVEGDVAHLLSDQVALEMARRRSLADLAALEQRAEVRQHLVDEIRATPEGQEYDRTHGHPGDVVSLSRAEPSFAEEARPARETTVRLIRGAEVREHVEGALKNRTEALRAVERQKLALATPDERPAIQQKIDALSAKLKLLIDGLSPLREPLVRELALCKEHGARLVVMVLPVDVQVSDAEWAKYGEPVTDMRPTLPLIEDVEHLGQELGIPVWSALPDLRDAEPGAFLDGDIHLTPKGHRAVAHAFASFLRKTDAITTALSAPPARAMAAP